MDIFPVLLLIFGLIFLFMLLIYSIYVKLPLEFRYEDRPNLLFLYLRVIRICWKRRCVLNLANSDISELALTQERVEVIGKDCRLVDLHIMPNRCVFTLDSKSKTKPSRYGALNRVCWPRM